MARLSNAKGVQYNVATKSGSVKEADWQRLAKYITTVTDSGEDVSEEYTDYLTGSPVQAIKAYKEVYEFEGFYDETDPAMKLIKGLKRETGDKKIIFFQVKDSETTASGEATVYNIVAGDGEASEYRKFKCTIAFNGVPEVESNEE